MKVENILIEILSIFKDIHSANTSNKKMDLENSEPQASESEFQSDPFEDSHEAEIQAPDPIQELSCLKTSAGPKG